VAGGAMRLASLGSMVALGLCLAACGSSASSGSAASTAGPVAKSAATPATTAPASTANTDLIAFMRPGQVGEYDIWVVHPDGGALRRLTSAPAGRSDYNPAWSPDGSTVLFERRKLDENAAGGDEALYAVGTADGGVRQVTQCQGDCWSDSEAAWSADGTRIAFGRATGPRDHDGPTLVAVYVAAADGSGVRQLTSPPSGSEDHYPTWSPDGHTVVFERDRTSPAGPSQLIAVDVASGSERIVYTLPPWAPSAGIPKYSPDGKQILFGFWCVFGDQCPASTRSARNSRQATIRQDGKGLHVLPLKELPDSGNWSPDGDQVVYRCHATLGGVDFKLCTSKLDGSGLKQFPWPLGSAHPSWGPRS
jgi:Tol biopolymer transport system component